MLASRRTNGVLLVTVLACVASGCGGGASGADATACVDPDTMQVSVMTTEEAPAREADGSEGDGEAGGGHLQRPSSEGDGDVHADDPGSALSCMPVCDPPAENAEAAEASGSDSGSEEPSASEVDEAGHLRRPAAASGSDEGPPADETTSEVESDETLVPSTPCMPICDSSMNAVRRLQSRLALDDGSSETIHSDPAASSPTASKPSTVEPADPRTGTEGEPASAAGAASTGADCVPAIDVSLALDCHAAINEAAVAAETEAASAESGTAGHLRTPRAASGGDEPTESESPAEDAPAFDLSTCPDHLLDAAGMGEATVADCTTADAEAGPTPQSDQLRKPTASGDQKSSDPDPDAIAEPVTDGADSAGGDAHDPCSEPVPGFNSSDIAYAAEMIPQYDHAMELVDLAFDVSHDPGVLVVDLAAMIQINQAGGAERMANYLTEWGQSSPARPATTIGGSAEDVRITMLRVTSGADFDTLWLRMMAGHHLRAIALSRHVLRTGASSDLRLAAEQVLAHHEMEMDQLMAALGE